MEDQSVPGQLDLLALAGFASTSASPPPPSAVSDGDPAEQQPAAIPIDGVESLKVVTPLEPEASPSDALDGPEEVSTLLILDTETTGLDPQANSCLEVGVVLFDLPSRQVLAQQSFLLPVAENPAEPINRIPAAATNRPQPWQAALVYFETLLAAADVVVAHNAAFDRQWFGHGLLPAITKPWLCSMEEMRWPPERQLRARPSVRDLALAYEIPVWAAHRALTDCIYLAEVFRRCEDLEELVRLGLEPRALFKAQVSYDQRHLAREAGFRWNDPVAGAWTRRLSDREAEALDFPVQRLETEMPLAS
jgi:DNA polymerase-3 subunit epsilon